MTPVEACGHRLMRGIAWSAAACAAIAAMGCQPAERERVKVRDAENRRAPPTMTAALLASESLNLLRKFAFNALVVPVLDVDDPARFAPVDSSLLCADRSQVAVNGETMVAGDTVPPGAFVLQWDLKMYCPFGRIGPFLDGRVDVLVFRDDEFGMDAVIRPITLAIDGFPVLRLDDTAMFEAASGQSAVASTTGVTNLANRPR